MTEFVPLPASDLLQDESEERTIKLSLDNRDYEAPTVALHAATGRHPFIERLDGPSLFIQYFDSLFSVRKIAINKVVELQTAIREIAAHAQEQNWNGEGADPVKPAAVDAAQRLLHEFPGGIPDPDISVDPEGNIDFDWHLDNGTMFTLSIGGVGDIAISGMLSDKVRLSCMELSDNDSVVSLVKCGFDWFKKMQGR